MNIFTNISKLTKDQWLKFDSLTLFGHLEMMHDLDYDFSANRNKKNWKIKTEKFVLC